ncbi:MAG: hypothetical protein ACI4J7_02340 [Ruminiclostridium sp.]
MLKYFNEHNIKVDLTFFCRVYNAEIFGGLGSIGYLSQTCEGTTTFKEGFEEQHKAALANSLGVNSSDIEFICEKEYKDNTEYEEGDDSDEDY